MESEEARGMIKDLGSPTGAREQLSQVVKSAVGPLAGHWALVRPAHGNPLSCKSTQVMMAQTRAGVSRTRATSAAANTCVFTEPGISDVYIGCHH